MSKTIYRILGHRGRTTIPFEIRQEIGFQYNDILSFTAKGDKLIVKREKLCAGCKDCDSHMPAQSLTLEQFLDGLSPYDQCSALVYLSVKWAQTQDNRKGRGNHAV